MSAITREPKTFNNCLGFERGLRLHQNRCFADVPKRRVCGRNLSLQSTPKRGAILIWALGYVILADHLREKYPQLFIKTYNCPTLWGTLLPERIGFETNKVLDYLIAILLIEGYGLVYINSNHLKS